nr:c-type cytochrome domain-containing protein [Ardenticatena sp.]
MRRNTWLLVLLILLAGMALLSACQPARSPTPKPTATFDYSLLPPRTTPVPLTPVPTATPGGDIQVSFRNDILPIFEENCVRCHGGVAGLWLTDYEHVLYGGFAGPILVPGDPEMSRLLDYLRKGTMPPDAPPLPEEEIRLIEEWIAAGAPNN